MSFNNILDLSSLTNNNNNVRGKRISESFNEEYDEMSGTILTSYRGFIILVIISYLAAKVLYLYLQSRNREISKDLNKIPYDFGVLIIYTTIIFLFNGYLQRIFVGQDKRFGMNNVFTIMFMLGMIGSLLIFVFFYKGLNDKFIQGERAGASLFNGLLILLTLGVYVITTIQLFKASVTGGMWYMVSGILITLFCYMLSYYNSKIDVNYGKMRGSMYLFTPRFALTITMFLLFANILMVGVPSLGSLGGMYVLAGVFFGAFIGSIAIYGIQSLVPDQYEFECGEGGCQQGKISEKDLGSILGNNKLVSVFLIIILVMMLMFYLGLLYLNISSRL